MRRNAKWGIAGIGKLGTALLTQFDRAGMHTGIYHPDQEKAGAAAADYTYAHVLTKEDLASLDYLILTLPAEQIEVFIGDLLEQKFDAEQLVFINMATKQSTSALRNKYPTLHLLGLKLTGHAESLRKYGEGLFVTESSLDQYTEAAERFSHAGRVIEDAENTVEKVNKLITTHAVQAARKLEVDMEEKGYSSIYIEQALRAVMPEVVRAYAKGELGQFARGIVEEIEKEK